MSDQERGNVLSTLILGVVVGAGLVYFLTSTKEGERVKKDLKKKGKIALDNLADLTEDLRTKGKEFKTKAKKVRTDFEKKAKSFKKEVAADAQEQLAHIDQLRERGRAVSKRFFTRAGRAVS